MLSRELGFLAVLLLDPHLPLADPFIYLPPTRPSLNSSWLTSLRSLPTLNGGFVGKPSAPTDQSPVCIFLRFRELTAVMPASGTETAPWTLSVFTCTYRNPQPCHQTASQKVLQEMRWVFSTTRVLRCQHTGCRNWADEIFTAAKVWRVIISTTGGQSLSVPSARQLASDQPRGTPF